MRKEGEENEEGERRGNRQGRWGGRNQGQKEGKRRRKGREKGEEEEGRKERKRKRRGNGLQEEEGNRRESPSHYGSAQPTTETSNHSRARERMSGASERTIKWPSTAVPILGCFEPWCGSSTMVENRKKHRQNSNLIIPFPTSEGVSEVSERANE